jgi:hypothetical protein
MKHGVRPFEYVRAYLSAWWYNLRNRVGFFVSRHLVRMTPRCECGWALVQRFDGLWVCGSCLNGSDATCPCYLCIQVAAEED